MGKDEVVSLLINGRLQRRQVCRLTKVATSTVVFSWLEEEEEGEEEEEEEEEEEDEGVYACPSCCSCG